MKEPEKIYLQACGDCTYNDCDNCKFEDLEDNVTWCKERVFRKDIEYIRTDAFIEKAEDFLYKNLNDGTIECGDIEKLIKDMHKAMKG